MECKQCFFFKAHASAKGAGNCFLEPPKLQWIPITVPGSVMQAKGPDVQMHPVSARPMVGETDFCGSYKFRAADGTKGRT